MGSFVVGGRGDSVGFLWSASDLEERSGWIGVGNLAASAVIGGQRCFILAIAALVAARLD